MQAETIADDEPCAACGLSHPPSTACPTSSMPMAGEVIAEKYRIERRIASGGMGSVWLATHTTIGRRFAIKFLRTDLAQRDKFLRRFDREARIAGALEHENIAAIADIGVLPSGTPFIVMEYLDGSTLRRIIQQDAGLPVPWVLEIVRQACLGLDSAHRAGVVHRDLKPENIMICRRADGADLVKLVDFGIAQLESPDATDATTTGSTLGTPAYMSPEQARGESSLDARADIYALGVILYELLTGRLPHPGDSYNAVMYHLLTKDVAPIRELRPELAFELTDTVERALASDPSERQPSAAALAEELEVLLPPPGARPGLADSSPTEPERSAISARPDATEGRSGAALLLAGLGCIIAGYALGVLTQGHGTPSSAAESMRDAPMKASATPPNQPSTDAVNHAATTSDPTTVGGAASPPPGADESAVHQPDGPPLTTAAGHASVRTLGPARSAVAIPRPSVAAPEPGGPPGATTASKQSGGHGFDLSNPYD